MLIVIYIHSLNRFLADIAHGKILRYCILFQMVLEDHTQPLLTLE